MDEYDTVMDEDDRRWKAMMAQSVRDKPQEELTPALTEYQPRNRGAFSYLTAREWLLQRHVYRASHAHSTQNLSG